VLAKDPHDTHLNWFGHLPVQCNLDLFFLTLLTVNYRWPYLQFELSRTQICTHRSELFSHTGSSSQWQEKEQWLTLCRWGQWCGYIIFQIDLVDKVLFGSSLEQGAVGRDLWDVWGYWSSHLRSYSSSHLPSQLFISFRFRCVQLVGEQ